MKRPLYLLDSYAIIYRSYFALMNRPLRNPSGANVSAAFGFFRFLFALFDERNPGAFAAVFDSRTKTFRHEMYPEYKATRQKTPEDLHAQIPLVEEGLAALKVPMLRAEGWEADDLIAAAATRCRAEGRECWVVSGDKDLLQLVGGSVRALRPDSSFAYRPYGAEDVAAEWGVPPERILDYLSLTGDASDNVPGVAGIGDKTALKLLTEFGSLDAIYARLAEVKPDSLRTKLEVGRESAMLSRRLITLDVDAPLGCADLDELNLEGLDRSAANPLFLREGMKSLVSKANAAGEDLFSAGAADAAGGGGGG
ncbi:MAG: DNA polymerase I, partial [Treponema sp.]|nr:DNA polymerase I [Treponema sp.]